MLLFTFKDLARDLAGGIFKAIDLLWITQSNFTGPKPEVCKSSLFFNLTDLTRDQSGVNPSKYSFSMHDLSRLYMCLSEVSKSALSVALINTIK